MSTKVLLIDNYDSFTYNLVQLVQEVTGERPTVVRNDELDSVVLTDYSHVILSPGPGIPDEAGDLKKTIGQLANSKTPTLGVCLGQQAIAEQFGGSLINLDKVYHGIGSTMRIVRQDTLFNGVPETFEAGRYHSWIVNRTTLPDELEVLCDGPEGEIMAIRHKSLPILGVQFHPESILTKDGKTMIKNFLMSTK
ncbi:MAG: aminodeoxychorismate/anthranilate synthase component II [Cyclobacteriaceae bacterium]|nr:aminodeoxychorismate/anthranilate synthase component II [Cyclobacteriaceae bacterium]